MTAAATILDALAARSDDVLVIARGEGFTGQQLLDRIRARAADLKDAGLRSGDRVLIVVSDNLAAMEQLLASWTLGASGCFVDFRTPPARLAEWHERLGAALVLATRATGLPHSHVQPYNPPAAAQVRTDWPLPEQEALIVASSGTTGLPSLFPKTQAAMEANLQAQIAEARTWGIWDGSGRGAMLAAISVGYSAAAFQWLRNLSAGRPIVALSLAHTITELDAALQRPDVSECALPPAMIRRLTGLPPAQGPRYPGLKRLTSVGGPARPDDKLAAVQRLSLAYVMTYSCVGFGLISRISGPEILNRPGSCGRPVLPVTVEICDQGRPCAVGEVGEIVVSNAALSTFRPGDVGWLDAEGYLYVTGRKQGLLCRNGVSFRAERLIDQALAFPQVTEAAVLALPDADHGDAIHLVVEAPAAIASALEDHLRCALPLAERPDRLHLRAALPLTAAGKVNMPLLRETLLDHSLDPLGHLDRNDPNPDDRSAAR